MAAGTVLAGSLAAGCTGDPADQGGEAASGQLTVLTLGPVPTWDPQRMSDAQSIAFAGRVFVRTLTAFPAGSGATSGSVVGDLATDTGKPDAKRRNWQFTLRDGVKWQDGSPVTCEDVKYGVSRSFAPPNASEGLNFPQAYLDIPRKANGASVYTGPGTKAGDAKAAFDKAVSCEGSTVTFRLSTPVADFNKVVASPSFAPVKKEQDEGERAPHAVFSNGPYQLKDPWDASAGGTFVRNPHWSADTDPVRKARPSSIRYVEGTESQTAAQQVINDGAADRQSVTMDSAPPAMQQHVLSDPQLRSRSVNPSSSVVDYLAPNFAKGVMTKPAVRRALALATNRDGYVAALGGASAASPTRSLIGSAVPGHREQDPTVGRPDTAAARAALEGSKLTLPVPIRVAYRSTPTADKAMAALANGWEDAGFKVTLQPITDDYFPTIAKPDRVDKTDVFWANWAPAWPSAQTMLRPLFDSRLNLVGDSVGRDYGRFADKAVDKEMARIAALPDVDEQAHAWSELDEKLAEEVAFVALAERRSLYVAGSKVTGFAANEALGGYVDLAEIGVAD